MELFKASRQWSSRPPDERFDSVDALNTACHDYAAQATTAETKWSDLTAEADGDEVSLRTADGTTCLMTHWAFGQVAQRAGAPAAYLRDLPAPLAAQCLQHGLTARENDVAQLLYHHNGSHVLRAATSEKYARIWNCEVTERLQQLVQKDAGWRVPPARPAFANQPGTRRATMFDVLEASDFGLSVKVGDLIAPAGLYASDHDMFAFLINEQNRLDDGTDGGLSRGFFVWNSEVGAASFGIQMFMFRHCCGNHIVWGAKDVKEIRIRHLGKANDKAMQQLSVDLKEYANSSVSDDQARIVRAKTMQLGTTKDEVLDALMGIRSLQLGRNAFGYAYDEAELHEATDGSPRSVWGMAQGLTRISQDMPHMDFRLSVDRVAAKVLELAA